MAPEWESMAMGIDFGMGMEASQYYNNGSTGSAAAAAAAAAPFSSVAQYFDYNPYCQSNEHTLHIDELLDFSNQELAPAAQTVDSQLFTPPLTDHHQSSIAGSGFFTADQSSSFDLYIPHEEVAELEWLSKFVDDSFSDVPYHSMNMIAPPTGTQSAQLRIEQSGATAGRGARSKRSRAGAGNTQAAAWSSLVHHPQLAAAQSSPSSSSSSSSDITSLKPNPRNYSPHNNNNRGKKGPGIEAGLEGGVRRCTHCASEKTPQWRTGPLGPKTLCNACGVRYKSGRLVPEYRPAASPTFVLTQHSNSHRKVMELRRQKEVHILNNAASSAAAVAHAARPELMFNDYGVC